MAQPPEWIEIGRWALPQPGPGETPLHCWVVDRSPYVLIALLTACGEIYRLCIYGYEPSGAQDTWTADSNTSLVDLRNRITREFRQLALSWGGRVRSINIEAEDDWVQAVQAALADGVGQDISVSETDDDTGPMAA